MDSPKKENKMTSENINKTLDLVRFIENSPTAFHAVAEISKILDDSGFTCLSEGEEWDLEAGGKYYVTRNLSSIIAFALPENYAPAFMISASHTDSPTYKLKSEYEAEAFGKYIKLNTEGYGGMIASTWLDRPLSIAGRVIVSENGRINTKLTKIDRDLVLIPNVAIHQNRSVNSGYTFNPAVDMMPLYSSKQNKGSLARIIAEDVGCGEESIVSADLYLYNRTPASIWGADNEFFSSPRIDNLQCAYATLCGFVDATESGEYRSIPVYSSFDNEETGSATKQGAASGFLSDVLSRIANICNFELPRALTSSFMVSADNGHAKHPNHPELSDSVNSPHLNEGVVIKSNASQKYTTDAVSSAIFKTICKNADVPVQVCANRSDMPGGSTLGSISDTRVSLNTVDIGLAQLAMHSSYETAGTADTLYMIRAIREFYKTTIKCDSDGSYSVQ